MASVSALVKACVVSAVCVAPAARGAKVTVNSDLFTVLITSPK